MMTSFKMVLAFVTLSGAAEAQDWSASGSMRFLERPQHEALTALIRRPATTLAPFETDGCSGGLSEAWRVVAGQFPDFTAAHRSAPPWESCCITHDRAYHNAGGTTDAISSFDARLTADLDLRACVISVGTDRVDELAYLYDLSPDQVAWAYENIAEAMYQSVRIGGAPCSAFFWRWGYGYPPCSTLFDLSN